MKRIKLFEDFTTSGAGDINPISDEEFIKLSGKLFLVTIADEKHHTTRFLSKSSINEFQHLSSEDGVQRILDMTDWEGREMSNIVLFDESDEMEDVLSYYEDFTKDCEVVTLKSLDAFDDTNFMNEISSICKRNKINIYKLVQTEIDKFDL